MEAEDYKTLLKQAEDELGKTPGAYCSRKAALRAMELLRAAGQVEVDQKAAEYKAGAENNYRQWQEQKAIIERQAQAIRRLEAEKMRGVRLGSEIPTDDRTLAKSKGRAAYDTFVDRYINNMREVPNIKLDDAGDWKQR